ncbi:MAG: DUF485 domain-containing protein, partial [Rhizobacter sp.]|nr:DUF485 domain-containing protein [Rhizobacter sp.]
MQPDLTTRSARDQNYQLLKSRRRRFGSWLTLAMMVAYCGFMLLVASDKPFLATRLGQGVTTIGMLIGLGLIVFTVIITAISVKRAKHMAINKVWHRDCSTGLSEVCHPAFSSPDRGSPLSDSDAHDPHHAPSGRRGPLVRCGLMLLTVGLATARIEYRGRFAAISQQRKTTRASSSSNSPFNAVALTQRGSVMRHLFHTLCLSQSLALGACATNPAPTSSTPRQERPPLNTSTTGVAAAKASSTTASANAPVASTGAKSAKTVAAEKAAAAKAAAVEKAAAEKAAAAERVAAAKAAAEVKAKAARVATAARAEAAKAAAVARADAAKAAAVARADAMAKADAAARAEAVARADVAKAAAAARAETLARAEATARADAQARAEAAARSEAAEKAVAAARTAATEPVIPTRAIEPVAVAFPVASAAVAMPKALGAPVTTAEPAAAETRREYVVGGGDVLRVAVYQSPDLSLDARVSEHGTISYPLVGQVSVGGLSIAQVEAAIADGLRDGNFIKQPQVSVLLVQVRGNQASVLGMANRPGRYPLEVNGMLLTELLALAGGVAAGGSEIVTLSGTRNGRPFHQRVDINALFANGAQSGNPIVSNGDTLYIDRLSNVYIHGEVQRPGPIPLMADMTLMQAV